MTSGVEVGFASETLHPGPQADVHRRGVLRLQPSDTFECPRERCARTFEQKLAREQHPVALALSEHTLGGHRQLRYPCTGTMADVCTHLDMIRIDKPPRESVAGCEECLKTGGRSVHLRVCRSCGHVGCCDSSPNRHATKHAMPTSTPS